jgi:NAD(P)-dependent dehydrogenase (short-subunit alcohol dehydrogenase family)
MSAVTLPITSGSSASPAPRRATSALVTGAGRRLGRAIAWALAQEGWPVAVHYRSARDEAESLVAAITEAGGQAAAFYCDLAQPLPAADIDLWFNKISEQLGPVEVLVNSASLFSFDLADSCNAEGLLHHYQTNLIGPVLLTQALYRHVQKRPYGPSGPVYPCGVAINLLDQKLANPNPDFFSYTLSKAALQQATALMARSLAPWLRVVGLSPGFTLIAEGQSPQAFAQAHRISPLGESSRPEEIAQAVCWIATARAITGSTILVDGGQHLIPSSRDLQFVTGPTPSST